MKIICKGEIILVNWLEWIWPNYKTRVWLLPVITAKYKNIDVFVDFWFALFPFSTSSSSWTTAYSVNPCTLDLFTEIILAVQKANELSLSIWNKLLPNVQTYFLVSTCCKHITSGTQIYRNRLDLCRIPFRSFFSRHHVPLSRTFYSFTGQRTLPNEINTNITYKISISFEMQYNLNFQQLQAAYVNWLYTLTIGRYFWEGIDAS